MEPRTEIDLLAEVSGRVVEVTPHLVDGAFVEKGDLLLRVEDLDYDAAVKRAASALKQAELKLELEKAQAEVSADEWQDLGLGEASPLALREVQVADAEAAVAAARAALEQAKRDLDRTRIHAPFTGRIRREFIDAGAYLTRGARVATVYATDAVEVRLPVPGHDLAFADFPLQRGASHQPAVTLRADFAGSTATWQGRIVRTEGAIDPASRMLYVVARIDDPYAGDPPLPPGLFVDASIEGRLLPDAIVLPRSALREDGTVVLVGDDDRLSRRPVEVARYERDLAVIRGGVEPGDRVLVSPLATVVDGMKVRVSSDAPEAPGEMTESVDDGEAAVGETDR